MTACRQPLAARLAVSVTASTCVRPLAGEVGPRPDDLGNRYHDMGLQAPVAAASVGPWRSPLCSRHTRDLLM